MFKSWRLGAAGFPIEINLSFLILLGLVLVAFGGLIGVLVVCIAFASVVLHELRHAVVARQLGVLHRHRLPASSAAPRCKPTAHAAPRADDRRREPRRIG
jgi:hypothetical protein